MIWSKVVGRQKGAISEWRWYGAKFIGNKIEYMRIVRGNIYKIYEKIIIKLKKMICTGDLKVVEKK